MCGLRSAGLSLRKLSALMMHTNTSQDLGLDPKAIVYVFIVGNGLSKSIKPKTCKITKLIVFCLQRQTYRRSNAIFIICRH